MQSLIAKTKSYLTPTTSSANLRDSGKFRTEKQADALFQKVDAEIDGEDCLHDCASCTEQLPRKWEIDEDDKLYGHVNGWETHLIVGTGKTDWVRDVTDEKGSLMQAVGKLGLDLSNGKVMLSASDMAPSSDADKAHDISHAKKGSEYANEGRTRCIVLPKWEMLENVGTGEAKWLLDDVIGKSNTNSTPISKTRSQPSPSGGETVTQDQPDPAENEDTNGNVTLNPINPGTHQTATSISTNPIPEHVIRKPLHHRAVILMCSHGTRDWRCGKSAPILKRELERHLRPLGLYRDANDDRPGGVGIYFINHVGGHKYSANVMVYRRQGRAKSDVSTDLGSLSDEAVQGIWLARVRPEDCENIVKFTVLQGKLVKPLRQLRGGFDRERGVVSW